MCIRDSGHAGLVRAHDSTRELDVGDEVGVVGVEQRAVEDLSLIHISEPTRPY